MKGQQPARLPGCERTLSILKPDATQRNLTGEVNAMIERAGLRIVAQKRVWLREDQAREFYAVHAARPFYDSLCASMIAGPIVVQVLQGEDAIGRYRTLMGATDPAAAADGTIRRRFGESIEANTVHGSDSPCSAGREIAFFFSELEIVG